MLKTSEKHAIIYENVGLKLTDVNWISGRFPFKEEEQIRYSLFCIITAGLQGLKTGVGSPASQ